MYPFMRSWRRSSSITFIIDIFSFDQYFRSYREKLVPKTSNLEFSRGAPSAKLMAASSAWEIEVLRVVLARFIMDLL